MAWLSGYSKRKALTLTGGASGAQIDFQLKLAVSYAAAMQGDFDDLRFTQADGTTLIDAWAEVIIDDTSATVWVEFPTTPANTVEQTYYMYYGRGSAVSNWDIGETFIFGDDFEIGDGLYSASRAAGSSIGFNAACPRVVVADDGTWLMVYRATSAGAAPSGHEGQVWIRSSTDAGETWSSGTKLSSDSYDAINAEFIKYPNGDIDIFYTRYDNSTSTRHEPNMVSRSTNNGSSWSAFATAPTPLDSEYQTMWQDIIIGTEVYLSTHKQNCSTGEYDCKFYKTTNNGSTWTHISDITTHAADGDYVEPGTVYLGDGDFVTVLRSGSKVDTLQKRSTDWGVTWTTDGYIKDDGSVAASGVGTDVRLHQCRIFNKDINGNDLGYVYMQSALYPGGYPRDMYAYISTDDCASWATVDPIYTAGDCHDSAITFKSSTSAKYYPGKISGESATTDDDITISLAETPLASKWDLSVAGVSLSTDYAFVGSKSAKFSNVGAAKLQKTLTPSDSIAIMYWAYFPDQIGTPYPFAHGDSTSRLYTAIGTPAAGDISYHDGAWQDTGVNTITGAWAAFEAKDFNWAAHTQDILYNDVVIASNVGQRPGNANNDMLQIYSGGAAFYVDCFIVRKYVANPPTYAFGSEESAPTSGRPSIFPRVFDVYFRAYTKGISFDGIELKNPEPFAKPKLSLINSVILESGKQSIQASTETAFAGTFKCHTGNHANVTDLYGKIGTKASLIVDEYTYANCYISSFSELQWYPGEWNYEISFVQETA